MKHFPVMVVAALAVASPLAAKPLATKPASSAAAVSDPARSADNRAMDEGREPAQVLDFVGFAKGQVVADYSAGGGYYSELISRVIGPKGGVIALESPRYFKADVWDRLRASHPNVAIIASDNLDLAPRSVDAVFTHLVFHDLFLPARPGQAAPDSQRVLANWFAAIRPGGQLIIADHVGNPGNVTITAGTLHRIDPAAARAAAEKAGFQFVAESSVLHRSMDDHLLRVFDPSVRGKTDRFLMKFKRP